MRQYIVWIQSQWWRIVIPCAIIVMLYVRSWLNELSLLHSTIRATIASILALIIYYCTRYILIKYLPELLHAYAQDESVHTDSSTTVGKKINVVIDENSESALRQDSPITPTKRPVHSEAYMAHATNDSQDSLRNTPSSIENSIVRMATQQPQKTAEVVRHIMAGELPGG